MTYKRILASHDGYLDPSASMPKIKNEIGEERIMANFNSLEAEDLNGYFLFVQCIASNIKLNFRLLMLNLHHSQLKYYIAGFQKSGIKLFIV